MGESGQTILGRLNQITKQHAWASGVVLGGLLLCGLLACYHYKIQYYVPEADRSKQHFEFKDMIENIVQVLGFLITGLLVYISIVKEEVSGQESASQQIYQRLELESVAIFRFDIEHTDLSRYIWGTRPLPVGTSPHDEDFEREEARLLQYVAQILNLFEMAVRFRKDGVMKPDIFGSWVLWMCNLCESGNYRQCWLVRYPELRGNYVLDLRYIIDNGVKIFQDPGDKSVQELRLEFFNYVGERINCNVIKEWYIALLDDAATQNNSAATAVKKC